MGFVENYISYAGEFIDSPEIYHKYMAYYLMSSVIQRNIFWKSGDHDKYCNLWLIMIGKSRRYRKSTSYKAGLKLLEPFEYDKEENPVGKIYMYEHKFSEEGLLDSLEEKAQGVLYIDEFTGLLDQFKKDYMLGMKQFLTSIYDCQNKVTGRTRKGGKKKAENCYFNFGGTSTQEWWEDSISTQKIKSGFFARFIYLIPEKIEKHYDVQPLYNKDKGKELIRQLNDLQIIKGEAVFSKEATAVYIEWVGNYEKKFNDSLFDSYYGELQAGYVFKFAILTQLSIDGDLNISKIAMEIAMDMVDELSMQLKRFSKGIKIKDKDLRQEKILEIIKEYQPISRTEIYKHMDKITAMELTECIINLKDSGKIIIQNNKLIVKQ